MIKRKVLTIIGTRPEAIKLAPVVLELKRRHDLVDFSVCVTAQHREMLDQPLALFGIKPDYDLDIMSPGQTLAKVTALAMEGIDNVVSQEKPDVILVQGDTTTAFCGALTGYYHQIKVAHVEAGLRTGNKYAPFPEEINRCLIGRIADLHFAPTEQARQTLLNEGVTGPNVFVTGNTVIDALLWVRERVRCAPPKLPAGLLEATTGKQIILVTGHRRESFGNGFDNICHAIREIADSFVDVAFIYPVHLNPNVREPVNRILGRHPRIHLIEPLSYAPFVWLMDRATIVLTDSGGVQEEAPSLGKPVLVMREMTERTEGITTGNALLVGVQRERIVDGLRQLLCDPQRRAMMVTVNNPYGDGRAAQRIVEILLPGRHNYDGKNKLRSATGPS
ncbi:MAG: UDP-N-acetylglucosamine 2-epimerase (non-hydrolyzing) [Deltaproteobacteria bacterium]|nr:UDP-N-acetylglucosamine 2-epimerase (non-hydrolyzing) [Deltaproteobacteria bacterium]